jgi:hypothetical protein
MILEKRSARSRSRRENEKRIGTEGDKGMDDGQERVEWNRVE